MTACQGLEIGLTDDPTIKLLQGAVSGYEEVANRDTVYTELVDGGLVEIVPGLAIGIDSLSSIEVGDKAIRLAIAGSQPVLVFRNANVQEVTKVGDGGYTWDLPSGTFTILKAAAESYVSDLNVKISQMIADRMSADDTLQAAIDAHNTEVDQLIATGMWLFADQAAFPPAADNHGRVVHSHADGAIFYAHGGAWHQVAKEADLQTTIASVASEATARTAADDALSGRLDVLEADPTTATAVAAGDAATLSSANTYTDTSITNLVNGADAALDTLKEIGDALAQGDSDVTAALTAQITTEATARANADTGLSGRLDTLEADPTTQTLLDAETTSRTSADTALDGRVTTLEGNAAITDPTTATAVAAVQSDVDQNEADSDAADAALSGRLDVLEADPTTATAVAAVQSDVDQNEADSDAADAALSGRLDVLEADPTTATAVAAVQSDVDQNEADADAALALRALLDGSNIHGTYNNDTDAAAGGVSVGGIYKNSNGTIHWRVS